MTTTRRDFTPRSLPAACRAAALCAAAAAGVLTGTGRPAAAQVQALSYAVTPMHSEVAVQPGGAVTATVTIHNDEPIDILHPLPALHLKLYTCSWTLDPLGQPTYLLDPASDKQPDSCTSWVDVNPRELTLAAGQEQEVRYTVHAPPGAHGTYHTMLMMEQTLDPALIRGRRTIVEGRIGSAIYVAAGPQVARAHIDQFVATPKQVTLTVRNTGSSELRLSGKLQLSDAAGHTTDQIPLPGAVVLPGADGIRTFLIDIPKPKNPALAPTQATALIDYGGGVILGARSTVAAP